MAQQTPQKTQAVPVFTSSVNAPTQNFLQEFEQLLKAQESEATFGEAKDSAIVRLVDLIVSHGYYSKASDVHIDPERSRTVVRFRIDGVMQDIVVIPKEIHNFFITRIKILAKLRTDEHQVPQDGKLEYIFGQDIIDVRVSIVPTTKGENIVMRLLSAKARDFSLEKIGLSAGDYATLVKNIKKPWGMILATGPTGAGKTTTLYGVLKILNQRDVSVVTIEDPVEYNIDGVTQIQIRAGSALTFASGLRAIVRQDPNIIMVGEIRDEETADIAVNSAMTGHIVLSSLHTNDAATALPRFVEMGVKPFLIGSTINAVIGQRLVRKICQACLTSTDYTLAQLAQKIPPNIVTALQQRGKEQIKLYNGSGCMTCQKTGYSGRIGIFELLEMTEKIRGLVMQNADAGAIQKAAVEQGMRTMFENALDRVLEGQTTLEEMLRVIKI